MVATIVLVRHGRTSANERGILAGRSPGVTLDEVGQEQATALARRLAAVPFTTIVTSPLERTRETAERIHAQQEGTASDVAVDERFIECVEGNGPTVASNVGQEAAVVSKAIGCLSRRGILMAMSMRGAASGTGRSGHGR